MRKPEASGADAFPDLLVGARCSFSRSLVDAVAREEDEQIPPPIFVTAARRFGRDEGRTG